LPRLGHPTNITAGPDGNLWFGEDSGGAIWRMTPSGVFTEFPFPTPGSSFGAIATGPDGALWFTEPSAGSNRIGRITTAGAITEFPMPAPFAGPLGIAAGSDGALWFTESTVRNNIGRITTSGVITEYPIPTPGSGPLGIVAGVDGNLYFIESEANKIGRITTSGVITEFPVPTPGALLQGIASGPDGAIWFTEFAAGQIGRLSIGPLTCEPDATTMCLNASRFRVTADWRKADGTTGQGQAVALTPDSGYFWFFNPANIEVVVKVLNACSVNDRYWVFGAGLTNVEVTLRVVDTFSGSAKTYANSLGTAYQPIQDASAFATCP